jgi:glycosyltransferase involved in cell wall biosynthesis
VIVGGGPLEASLHQRVPARLRDRIIWTGFLGDAREIAAIYRTCDVQVHPADWEPWGLVLNEATAAGLAIVASDVTGAAGDLVQDGINGWVFPHGDLPRLTDCLRMATDPARIDSLREGSRRVLAEYRARADPVDQLRGALRRFGVI